MPIELLAEPARSVGAPCVALAQIGVDADGRDVLVDLEALGLLAVAAPAELADEVVRGIAATLASSVFAEVANLIGVGLDASVFLDHRHAHQTAHVDDALELAATLLGTTGSASARRSTFVLRARHTGGEAWEPAVVFAGSEVAAEVTADLVRSASVRRGGLAMVVAGEPPGAPWSLRADDRRWVLEPLGITLVPVGLTAREVDEIHDVLQHADAPLVADEGRRSTATVARRGRWADGPGRRRRRRGRRGVPRAGLDAARPAARPGGGRRPRRTAWPTSSDPRRSS